MDDVVLGNGIIKQEAQLPDTVAAHELKREESDSESEGESESHSDTEECDDIYIEILQKENDQLKRHLAALLKGSLPNKGVFCTIVYNRLSVDSQKQIEDIIQKEFDQIDKDIADEPDESKESEGDEVTPPRALLQYYKEYIVDKMGDAKFLLKTNVMSAAPKYDRLESTLGVVEQAPQSTPKTPRRGSCWNCGSTEHQLTDCPQPRNSTAIDANRQKYLNSSQSSSTPNSDARYYVEGMPSIDNALVKHFKPGVLSQELKNALGMRPNDNPPFYPAMRIHGYPPAYLVSELKMDDPCAKETNEPIQKAVFPGLNITPTSNNVNGTQHTPTGSTQTGNNQIYNTTPSYTGTPNYNATQNYNATPQHYNTTYPASTTPSPNNSRWHSAGVNPSPRTPNASPSTRNSTHVFSPPFSHIQPTTPYMVYAAGNPPTQQFQHIVSSPYKPPINGSSDIVEADMDVT